MAVLESKSIKESVIIKSVSTEFTGNYYLGFNTSKEKIEFVGKRSEIVMLRNKLNELLKSK